MLNDIDFRPVILAGGSGTRFWPRSRRARAKQVLALDGERSMIQQTVERLKPLTTLEKTWIITNEFLGQEIADQLPGLPAAQIVQEPVGRNTAPACGLAAFLIERDNPDAVLGVFPSDHVISDEPRFIKAMQRGIACAAAGENIVVLGIEPSRAETGYGYIETGDLTKDDAALHVRRFIEKPNQNRADEFVAAGNYYWNSGIFLWSARTLANAVREHLPETAPLLESIAAAWGTPQFDEVRPRASTFRICTVFRPSSPGTISAHGLPSTSTNWKRACAATPKATWLIPAGTWPSKPRTTTSSAPRSSWRW